MRAVLPYGNPSQSPLNENSGTEPGNARVPLMRGTRGVRKDGTDIALMVRPAVVPHARGAATLLVLIGAERVDTRDSDTSSQLSYRPVESALDGMVPIVTRLFACGTMLTSACGIFDLDPSLVRKLRTAVVELARAIDGIRRVAMSTVATPPDLQPDRAPRPREIARGEQ